MVCVWGGAGVEGDVRCGAALDVGSCVGGNGIGVEVMLKMVMMLGLGWCWSWCGRPGCLRWGGDVGSVGGVTTYEEG